MPAEGGAHGPVGQCGWVAVIVGEEQPAAGRADIICGDLHKSSLQYLMEQKGLNCPYLTPDPLSLRPSDSRHIQYMVDYCKAHEEQHEGDKCYGKSAAQAF